MVGGLAVAGVAAAFFGPILAVTGGSKAAVVTTLAYPLLDVLLLLVVTALVALFSWRPPVSLWLLFGGLVAVRGRRRRLPVLRQPTAPTSRAGWATPSGSPPPW